MLLLPFYPSPLHHLARAGPRLPPLFQVPHSLRALSALVLRHHTLLPYTPLFRSPLLEGLVDREHDFLVLEGLGDVVKRAVLHRFDRAVDRREGGEDRKSTRLNSSHSQISYAVFCLKKKSDSDAVVALLSVASAPPRPSRSSTTPTVPSTPLSTCSQCARSTTPYAPSLHAALPISAARGPC